MTEKSYIGWVLNVRKQKKEKPRPTTIKALHASGFAHISSLAALHF